MAMLPGADPTGHLCRCAADASGDGVYPGSKTTDYCPVPPKLTSATGASDEAEVVFNALPGKVYSGKLAAISPAVPGGTYQSNGALQSLNSTPGSEGVIATIELNENVDVNALPDGIYAQVAVYSDHFAHVSVMRKVLLRMTSWVHYLYLDH